MIKRLPHVLRAFLIFALCAGCRAGDIYPGEKWQLVDGGPGWSTERLKVADEFARTLQTDAYVVVDNGVIVHEFGTTTQATNLHSIRKSILSVLYGIYWDRGVVDLDKTLADLGIDDKDRLTATEKQATVRQLLQARSGVYHHAAYETDAMGRNRPARGSFPPGDHWYYNNWDFNALGTIFKKFTGKTVFESLRDDLAAPLQFENFSYFMDTRFQYEPVSEHPAYIMRISARDLARVGLLMARGGQWADRRIVSEKWVEESTTSYSRVSARTGYGYLWWIGIGDLFYLQKFPGKVFAGEGAQGQHVIVDPVRDLVIVHRVNAEHDHRRNVTAAQFAELLGKIMEARLSERP